MTANFHTPHAFGAPLTSAGVNSPLDELDAAIGRLNDAIVLAENYGVVGDDATDNYPMIAAAIAALPNGHGTIIFPDGVFQYGTPIDLSTQHAITLRGQSGLNTSTTNGSTILKYTGTGASCINMQQCVGVRLEFLSVVYSNATFSGRVIDNRYLGIGTAPAYCALVGCIIGGSGAATGAAFGIDLDGSTRFVARDSLVMNCQVGAGGASSGASYANNIIFDNTSFRNNVVMNVKNPNQAWTFMGCEFNPLANGRAGAISHDAGVLAFGLTIFGSWLGDVTDVVNPSAQFTLAGQGINIFGNYIAGKAATVTSIKFDALSSGVDIHGNNFEQALVGVDWGAFAHTNHQQRNNYFHTVTTMETPLQRSLWLAAHDAGLDSGTLTTVGTAPDVANAVQLADAATQGAFWLFKVPADWQGGPLVVTPIWAPGSSDASSHAVRWSLDVIERNSSNVSIGSGGTTTVFTGAAAAYTANRVIYDTPTSSGVTPSQRTNLIRLNMRRLGSDAADTYVGAVNLLGLLVTY